MSCFLSLRECRLRYDADRLTQTIVVSFRDQVGGFQEVGERLRVAIHGSMLQGQVLAELQVTKCSKLRSGPYGTVPVERVFTSPAFWPR